ncbi:ArsA family ATPase [Solicola gregarius]|uniref:arsenite-transporting ATPase n=1 Tax=Solicola gregarius TaxID=2908642 RepID=A0AA46YK68_9ACTN|nr:ArsA family ATPase [Solicola gregarius]UYM05400.1 ArsA family ATPase [Solicola gregarius]
MRIILFTGKGGVGKTTAAAGTAVLAGRNGLKTLVMSTDAAHSLADAFGVEPGAEPVEVDSQVWMQQVDAQRRFEASWTTVQGYLRTVLDASGVDPIAAEELTVLPGAEEVLALLELRDQAASGRWDLVIVDCAPTAETLRLLALPEALAWYMDRVFPTERRVVNALRPLLAKAAGVPMPRDDVFDAIERLHADLGDVHDLLVGPGCSVRLVLTPEAVVLAEARRAFTTLSLYGYRVDGVLANRVFPDAAADDWRQGWVDAQQSLLAEVDRSFAPLPVWQGAYCAAEPVGVDALGGFAADIYGPSDPFAVPEGEPMVVTRDGDRVDLSLALPLADTGNVQLARHGNDLVVTVGAYRRVLALPAVLTRLDVRGARVAGGRLEVRFGATSGSASSERGAHG